MPAWCSRSTRYRKLVRVAEPGGRRVVAGDLVAPGAAERVLHHRQELHVGEAQLGDVRGQLLGQLPVGQAGPPRAEVHLVDAHRLLVRLPPRPAAPASRASLHSYVELVHHRGGGRRHLRVRGQRVGLVPPQPVGAEDAVLVAVRRPARPGTKTSHTPLEPSERIGQPSCGAPAGEVADHPHARGRSAPTPRTRRRSSNGLRAEHRPQPLVPALADQVQVQLAEGGRVAVRVVGDAAVHLDPVVEHLAGHASPRRRPRRAPASSGAARRRPATATSAAPRRRVRMVVRPPAGCAPSTACGSCVSPAISWSIVRPSSGAVGAVPPESRRVRLDGQLGATARRSGAAGPGGAPSTRARAAGTGRAGPRCAAPSRSWRRSARRAR